MNCTPRCRSAQRAVSLTALAVLAGAAILLLPACGGGAPSAAETGAAPAVAATATATAAPPAASAEPTDAGARTRQGRYLTVEQAQALARRLDDRVVTVDARCCGLDAAELDVLMAFGIQAAANLPNDAPFLVRGRELRQAAAVANRLADLGATQVHVVVR